MPHCARSASDGSSLADAAWLDGISCDVTRALCRAAISADRGACAEVFDGLRATGHGVAALADRYIADAVRALGEAWCLDRVNWSLVTIGSARLQSLLHRLPAPALPHPDAPTVLLATGPDVAHTFGPTLLAHRLRRHGASLALELGSTAQSVGTRFQEVRPDAVFLSAGVAARCDDLERLVRQIRIRSRAVPIVVGGPLLQTLPDLPRCVGADFGTSDELKALDLCGLTARPQMHRT